MPAIKDGNNVCPPYIGAYNLSGVPIGYAGSGVDFAFDDVKVFDKALTEPQVRKLYQEGSSQHKKPRAKSFQPIRKNRGTVEAFICYLAREFIRGNVCPVNK